MSAPTQSYVRVERPDPIVRADSVAHVDFERRDVESMSRFLVESAQRATLAMAEVNRPTLQTATEETVWES